MIFSLISVFNARKSIWVLLKWYVLEVNDFIREQMVAVTVHGICHLFFGVYRFGWCKIFFGIFLLDLMV